MIELEGRKAPLVATFEWRADRRLSLAADPPFWPFAQLVDPTPSKRRRGWLSLTIS
jgi:hypothetical protein